MDPNPVSGAWCLSDGPNHSRALQSTVEALGGIADSLRNDPRPIPDTVGYNYVKIFDTPEYRNPSRDDSQQYELEGSQLPTEVFL